MSIKTIFAMHVTSVSWLDLDLVDKVQEWKKDFTCFLYHAKKQWASRTKL